MTTFDLVPFILFLIVISAANTERINVLYLLVLGVIGLLVSFILKIPNWYPTSHIVLPLLLPPILFLPSD